MKQEKIFDIRTMARGAVNLFLYIESTASRMPLAAQVALIALCFLLILLLVILAIFVL